MRPGTKHSAAARKKQSRAHLGITKSEATRRRMAAAQQRRRAREREDPQQRRMRLMYEARKLEVEADALRDRQLAEESVASTYEAKP